MFSDYVVHFKIVAVWSIRQRKLGGVTVKIDMSVASFELSIHEILLISAISGVLLSVTHSVICQI